MSPSDDPILALAFKAGEARPLQASLRDTVSWKHAVPGLEGSVSRMCGVEANFNAEGAEFFAKGRREKPSRTSASASASSAFKKIV